MDLLRPFRGLAINAVAAEQLRGYDEEAFTGYLRTLYGEDDMRRLLYAGRLERREQAKKAKK
jgi:hypothetical protein